MTLELLHSHLHGVVLGLVLVLLASTRKLKCVFVVKHVPRTDHVNVDHVTR